MLQVPALHKRRTGRDGGASDRRCRWMNSHEQTGPQKHRRHVRHRCRPTLVNAEATTHEAHIQWPAGHTSAGRRRRLRSCSSWSGCGLDRVTCRRAPGASSLNADSIVRWQVLTDSRFQRFDRQPCANGISQLYTSTVLYHGSRKVSLTSWI